VNGRTTDAALLNCSSHFAIFVDIVQVEDPTETIFDGTVNENRESENQIFESDVASIGSIDVLENK
jgi:hypothetical protein